MLITELIILLLGGLGLTNILVYSPIIHPVREWIVSQFTKRNKTQVGEYLVNCPICIGFWVGVLVTCLWGLGVYWLLIPAAISFCNQIAQIYFYPEN